MDHPRPIRLPIPREVFWTNLLVCLAGSVVLIGVPYVGTLAYLARHPGDPSGGYVMSITCLVPLIQGATFGWLCSRWRVVAGYLGAGFLILGADLVGGLIVFREGAICLLMASPILLAIIGVGIAIGFGIGRGFGRHHRPANVVRISLVPILMLTVALDTQTGAPDFTNAISDAVTIEAPPDYVWRYIAGYPENHAPPEYWLWKLGVPAPTQSIAFGSTVGAARECRFGDGLVFKERIAELVPAKLLVFTVTEQPKEPELIGHFSLDKGELYLEANADGSTTVIATSWYRLFVAPVWYFDWWASDSVRQIHFRVLGHVKRLAEADWAAERRRASP